LPEAVSVTSEAYGCQLLIVAGTYTELTSAMMPPPVRAAVAQAALRPVHLEESPQKAEAYIAEKLI
jgi:hypothetical protein